MAQKLVNSRDVQFLLHEVFEIAKRLGSHKRFKDFKQEKTIDMIIKEARNLAIKELLPANEIGDREGCKFVQGQVSTPDIFKKTYKKFCDGEWVAPSENEKFGGGGMPDILAIAAGEYFTAANMAFTMYPGLTKGAGRLIEHFGSDLQKKMFVKKLYTGEWCGTMVLTEPEAGSDVGALTAEAVKNDDNTYSIAGDKIFISGGNHNLTNNIIHLVLARTPNAPAGAKGISLFIVPKIWIKDDGSLSNLNDVVCTGIEEKMGIHGNATCSLSFGGKVKCRGLLLGQENKGMRAMFYMMNEARLFVGLQALGEASASYLNSLAYARTRVQGKELKDMFDPTAKSVAIINHPDVRRQLLTMKAYTEGCRSLIYYIGMCEDLIKVAGSEEEKERLQGIIDVLIPIAKGYVTDRCFAVTNHGVQVYGGYGYIKEFSQEQLTRDCRITMIYEGTNGIQAMDFLGRKLGMKKGKPIMDFVAEVGKTTAIAKQEPKLKELTEKYEKVFNQLMGTATDLGGKALTPDSFEKAFAFAHPFMMATGDVILGWLLLQRALTATKKLTEKPKKKDTLFYKGQIKTAEFFIESLLPKTFGNLKAIMNTNGAAIEIDDASF